MLLRQRAAVDACCGGAALTTWRASFAALGSAHGPAASRKLLVMVAGHSLGGSLAQLAGFDIAAAQLAEERLVRLPGRQGLSPAAFSAAALTVKLVKFLRAGDPVPLFPLLSSEIHPGPGLVDPARPYGINIQAPQAASFLENHSLARWLTHDLIEPRDEAAPAASAWIFALGAALAPHTLTSADIALGRSLASDSQARP